MLNFYKWLQLFAVAVVVGLISGLAFGQVEPPGTREVFDFLKTLPSLKEAGTLAIVVAVVQGLLLATRSKFVPLSGGIKLIVVLGLTWIVGILTLKLSGDVGWVEAVFHSNSMAAFQVFGHQLIKRIMNKEGQGA